LFHNDSDQIGAPSDADDELSVFQSNPAQSPDTPFSPRLNELARGLDGCGTGSRPSFHSSQNSWSVAARSGPTHYSSLESSLHSLPAGTSGTSSDAWNRPDGDMRACPPRTVDPSLTFLEASIAKYSAGAAGTEKTPRPRSEAFAFNSGPLSGPFPPQPSQPDGAFGDQTGLVPSLTAPTADQANQATTAVLQSPASNYLQPGAGSSTAGPSVITGQQKQAKTVADCLKALVESVVSLSHPQTFRGYQVR
jgi:hypothetical protein